LHLPPGASGLVARVNQNPGIGENCDARWGFLDQERDRLGFRQAGVKKSNEDSPRSGWR